MYKAVISGALFFVLCEAIIKINITVKPTIFDSKIEYEGEENKPIPDMEIKVYNLTEKKVSRGMKVQIGKVPTDIWKDLFHELKLLSVTNNVKISKARIIYVDFQRKVLHTSYPGKEFREPVVLYFTDNINSTWSGEGFDPSENTTLCFNIILDAGRFDYEDILGKMPKVIDFSVNAYKKETLNNLRKALTTMTGRLVSDETLLVAEIEYSATLIGHVVGHHHGKSEEYNFYLTPKVNNTMKEARTKIKLITTQRIEIRSYSEPKFEVYDNTSGRYLQLNLAVHVKSSADLNNKIAAAGDKLVVLYFMSPSCKDCEEFEVPLNLVSNGIIILKIDVEKLKDIAAEYNIPLQGYLLPEFEFIKNSKSVGISKIATPETIGQIVLKHK